jgi:hypothetical protein
LVGNRPYPKKMNQPICIRLKHVNPYGESHYFVSIGKEWPHKPGFFFVDRTTRVKEEAMCFESAEAAAQMMEMFDGGQCGWSVEVEDPNVK